MKALRPSSKHTSTVSGFGLSESQSHLRCADANQFRALSFALIPGQSHLFG
jgi:hypothetical protein